jgi:hypothetical protein
MRIDSRLIGFTAHRKRAGLFQSSLGRYVRSAVHSTRLKIELILPRATPLQSSFVRSARRSSFDDRLHLPLGFVPSSRHHSSTATFFSRSIPGSTSFRPQAFAASRRFLPRSSLQAYFIPLPRPGSSFVQGASLPPQPPFLIGRSFPPCCCCIDARTLRYVHIRCLSASRPLSAPGRVPSVRLFTSPKAAPLFEFHAPPGVSLSRRRPLLSQLPSAHDVTRSSFASACTLRCLRSRSPARYRISTFARANHRGDPRAVPFRVGLDRS